MVQMKRKQKTQECEGELHSLTVEMETQRWHCGSWGEMGCGHAGAAGTKVSVQGLGLCSVLAFVPDLVDVGIEADIGAWEQSLGGSQSWQGYGGTERPFPFVGGEFFQLRCQHGLGMIWGSRLASIGKGLLFAQLHIFIHNVPIVLNILHISL